MNIADYLDSPRMAEHVIAAIAAFLMGLLVFGVAALDGTDPDQPSTTVHVEARP